MMQRNLRSVFGQVRAAQVRRSFSSYPPLPPTASIEEEIRMLKGVIAGQRFLSRVVGWSAGFWLARAAFGDLLRFKKKLLDDKEEELIRKEEMIRNEKVEPHNVFLGNQRPKLKAIDEKVEDTKMDVQMVEKKIKAMEMKIQAVEMKIQAVEKNLK